MLLFIVKRGIIDLDVEHEAVELGFRQRIGAFLLDRVLRGDDEERLGQVVGVLAGRDLTFLHGFEQGGLRLGRRAVDLVGQEDVGEDRPLDEAESRGGPVRASSRTMVPVMSDGIRSGVNWMRLKDTSRIWLMELTMSVLARPGTPTQEAMAAREDGGEDLLDDLGLADDDAAELSSSGCASG